MQLFWRPGLACASGASCVGNNGTTLPAHRRLQRPSQLRGGSSSTPASPSHPSSGGGSGGIHSGGNQNSFHYFGGVAGGGRNDNNKYFLPALSSPVPSIHLLRARPSGNPMSARMSMKAAVLSAPTAYNRSYSLGFVHREDALLVRSHLCSKSKVEIIDYSENAFSVVSVEKKLDIHEMPMFVHEMDFQMFLELPFQQNVNVGFVHQVLEDNYKEILLEIQTLEAIEISPLTFRKLAEAVVQEDADLHEDHLGKLYPPRTHDDGDVNAHDDVIDARCDVVDAHEHVDGWDIEEA
jgi:hypothetical protein